MAILRDQYGRPLMTGAPARDPIVTQPTGAPVGGVAPSRYQRTVAQAALPVPVWDMDRFSTVTTLPFTLTTASSFLAIGKPDQYRTLLAFRVSSSSTAGTFLYIAFGQIATDATAIFALTPGSVVYLDGVVPQDDVYLAASGATVIAVAIYANTNVTLAGSGA